MHFCIPKYKGENNLKEKKCLLSFHIQEVPFQSERTWAINKHAVSLSTYLEL